MGYNDYIANLLVISYPMKYEIGPCEIHHGKQIQANAKRSPIPVPENDGSTRIWVDEDGSTVKKRSGCGQAFPRYARFLRESFCLKL